MNRTLHRVGAGALLVLMAGAAHAGDGAVLRYKGSSGDQSVYQLSLEGVTTIFHDEKKSVSRMGSEVFLTQRIAEVLPGGALSLVMKVDSGQTSIDGEERVLPVAGRVTKAELQPNGESRSTGMSGTAFNISQLQLVFPDEPVRVGATWSRAIPPSESVPVAMKNTYKIVGFEKIRDMDCVKILSQVRSVGEPAKQGVEIAMKADGTIYFAHKEGFLVDNKVTAEMTMAFSRTSKEGKAQRVVLETKLESKMAWQYRDQATEHGDE